MDPKDFQIDLNDRLEKYITQEAEIFNNFGQDADQIIEYTRDTILAGGKRARPYLFLIGYLGYGGDLEHFPWEIAVCIELYHQFLLIHDDVMDHDITRHGQPNITGRYLASLDCSDSDRRCLQTAESMAILAGDLCFSWVIEQIRLSTLSPTVKEELHALLHEITRHEVVGQQSDVLFNHRRISEVLQAEILDMYARKTSAYTLVLPLKFAAIIRHQSKNEQAAIDKFARPAGIAFQITDDMFDLFSDPKQTGKALGGDLRENKKTILLRTAYDLLSPSDWSDLDKQLGHELSETQILSIRKLMINNGVREVVEKIAAEQATQALNALENLSLKAKQLSYLRDIVSGLIGRSV